MKGILLVILTLFVHSAAAIETCDYSVQGDENSFEDQMHYDGSANSEFEPLGAEEWWAINLSKHLVQMDDVNIKFLALSLLDMSFLERIDTDVESDLPVFNPQYKLSVLNQIIESPLATVPTLLAASSMCSDLKGQCDIDQLNQKLFDLAPENLNIYLNVLEQAVKETDQELIEVILKQMSDSKYSQYLFSFTEQLVGAVDFYIRENPLNISKLEDNSYYQSVTDNVGMDVILKQNTMISFLAINHMHSPSLSPLVIACEEWQNNGENCKAIADVLIDKSDTHLMVMMGHLLAVKVDKLFGDAASLTNSQKQKEAYSEYQSCLLKNHFLLDESTYMLDQYLIQMMIENKNELETFEKASMYIYKFLQESGTEGAVNPKECGLRYIDF